MPKKDYFCPVRDRQANRHPDAARATLRRIVRRATGAVADSPLPPARRKCPGRGRSPGAGKPGKYPGRIPAETVKNYGKHEKICIPARGASFAACNSGEETTTTQIQEPVATILEYTPAPGQFINGTMAGFDHVASAADACSYAANRIASNNWVSLGGWGGRIVAAFAEPRAQHGRIRPLRQRQPVRHVVRTGHRVGVAGRQRGRSAQRYVVRTRGSEYDNAETIRNYEITYIRPAEAGDEVTMEGQPERQRHDRPCERTYAGLLPRMDRGE